MGCYCTPTKKGIVGLSVGVVLVVLGVALGPVITLVVHQQIREKLVLKHGTTFYKMWKDVPFPIYQKFYFLNVDNPDEVIDGGKPNFTEIGPFTYREYRVKTNVSFVGNGTFVTYGEKKYFTFVPDMSVGDEQTYITTINPLLPTISHLLKNSHSSALERIVNMILEGFTEDLFHNKTVREIVWGYRDPMLTLACRLAPEMFYTDIVGFMAGKNDSYDGYYEIFTGYGDITKLGKIQLYNGSRTLKFWTTPIANMINGSDGSLHAPFVKKSSVLYTFITDVCRSLAGTYLEDTTSQYGIKLFRFIAPDSVFANKSVNPYNAGFCTPPTHCLGTGVLNVSTCQIFNNIHLPIVLSNAHFLGADPKYKNSVNGLHADKTKHRTIIDVEPLTGLMLAAHKRLQVNVDVRKDSHFESLNHVRDLLFPVVWIDECTSADKKTSDKLDGMVFKPMRIASALRYTVIGLGAAVIVAAAIYMTVKAVQKKRRGRDEETRLIQPVNN